MIASWTIGVISLLTLLTSARLFRLAAGEPLWRVNMISFPFWLLFGFSYVAAVVVALDVPFLGYDPESMREHYMLSSDPRVAVWMLVMWMFIAIPLGALAVDRWGKGGSARVRMAAFRQRPLVPGLRLDEPGLFIVVACAMLVAIRPLACSMRRSFHSWSESPLSVTSMIGNRSGGSRSCEPDRFEELFPDTGTG